MNRKILQRLTDVRAAEATVLLEAGCFAGAFYLVGYAVECALKACIAKRVARHDFPDLELARESWTHRLVKLAHLSDVGSELLREIAADSPFSRNWAVATGWQESSRYDPDITPERASGLYYACTTRDDGVLPWIRRRW